MAHQPSQRHVAGRDIVYQACKDNGGWNVRKSGFTCIRLIHFGPRLEILSSQKARFDYLNTDKPKDDRWLKRHPNVHFHFTSTKAS